MVRGSDTMIVLVQKWAETYMQGHTGVQIEVAGGGSGTGIAALENGTTDLAMASRAVTLQEATRIVSRFGGLDARVVATDAIAVYVNPENKIPSISVASLARVFRGEIQRWSALGGPDAPIVLYSRENSSGTYLYFKEHVLERDDFALEAQSLPGTAAVIHAVSLDPNAIGYGGVAFARNVRVVPLAVDSHANAVGPDPDAVVSGRYPLARPLYLYALRSASQSTRDFLDWTTTVEAQMLAERTGFFPASASTP